MQNYPSLNFIDKGRRSRNHNYHKSKMLSKHLKISHDFINDVIAEADPGSTFDVLLDRCCISREIHNIKRVKLCIAKPARVDRGRNTFIDFFIEPLDLGYKLPCTNIHYRRRLIIFENPHAEMEEEPEYRCRIDLYNDRRRLGCLRAIIPVSNINQPTIDCLMSLSGTEKFIRSEEEDEKDEMRKERKRKWKKEIKEQNLNMTEEEMRASYRRYIRENRVVSDDRFYRRRSISKKLMYRIMHGIQLIP